MAVQNGGDGAGPNDEVHIRDIEATGGSKEGVVRWVLVIGTGITILALLGTALIGGLSQDTIEEEATVSGKIQSTESDRGNDGVLLGDDGSGSARDVEDQRTTGTTSDAVPNAVEEN